MTVANLQEDLARRAQAVIPGGVNSANRALPWPLVTREAHGAYFTDVEGKRYLDYHAAFGPLILGHNHPAVNAAARAAMDGVDLMGAGVTEPEIALAEKLVALVPSAERVLLTNSGSEATYAALRLARAGADFADALIGSACKSRGCARVLSFDRRAQRDIGFVEP